MKSSRSWIVSAVFVLTALAVGAWLYPHMPLRVATHWGRGGQVDGWSARWVAVGIWPLVIAGLAAIAWLLPAISPRKFEIKPFANTWSVLMLAVQAFMLVVGVCAMLAAAGYAVPMPLIASLAVGVLLMVLGNYMGKLRKNFFIGIRTPWTLASDAVWERTHRLAGWLFVLAGIAWVGLSLTPAAQTTWPLAVLVVGAAMIPYVYSYFVYRRLERRHGPEGEGP